MMNLTFWDEFWLKNSPVLITVIGGGLLVYVIRRWIEKSELLLNRRIKEEELQKIRSDNEHIKLDNKRLEIEILESEKRLERAEEKTDEIQERLNFIVKYSLADYVYQQLWDIKHKERYPYDGDTKRTNRTLILLRDLGYLHVFSSSMLTVDTKGLDIKTITRPTETAEYMMKLRGLPDAYK